MLKVKFQGVDCLEQITYHDKSTQCSIAHYLGCINKKLQLLTIPSDLHEIAKDLDREFVMIGLHVIQYLEHHGPWPGG